MIRKAALSFLLITGITCSASGQEDVGLPGSLGSVPTKQANGQLANDQAKPASNQPGELAGLVDEDVLTHRFAQPLSVAHASVGSGAAGGCAACGGCCRDSCCRSGVKRSTCLSCLADWQFIAQGQFWLPLRISGPVEIGPTSTDVDVTLGELLNGLQGLFEGGFEVTKDEWSLELWSLYMDVGADARTTALLGTRETDVDFKATLVDMTAAYRLGDWSLRNSETATWGLDLLAGLIVYDLDLAVDTLGPFGVDLGLVRDENWVDFIVGGRLEFKCRDRLSMSLRGEIGGFGIGSSSDLVWNTTLLAEYKLSRKHRLIKCHKNRFDDCRLVAGFRYFDVDWEQGSGIDRVGYDWEIWGPIVGVNIYF